IYISSGSWGNSLKIDFNIIHSPNGGSYSYGSSALRDLQWMQSNTEHQAQGLDADPRFRDLSSGDFRLTAQSPAIDAATEGIKLSGFADYQYRFSLNILQDALGVSR